MSLIDYCNSALAGLPQSTLAPLQRVQNAAACLVFELGAREHVRPSLLQLHWLPVRWCIQYKLWCLMHSVSHGNCPVYLKNMVQSASASRPQLRQHLRSTSSNTSCCHSCLSLASAPFHTPDCQHGTLCQTAFAVIQTALFRKHLKTHFFCSAFNVLLTFYSLILLSVDSVMHLCPFCNRRIINVR